MQTNALIGKTSGNAIMIALKVNQFVLQPQVELTYLVYST
ncbi:MAG: hypothetical protein ACJAS1_001751 [Oleiphilaceae bacterium]|jgi:hypothetical protein